MYNGHCNTPNTSWHSYCMNKKSWNSFGIQQWCGVFFGTHFWHVISHHLFCHRLLWTPAFSAIYAPFSLFPMILELWVTQFLLLSSHNHQDCLLASFQPTHNRNLTKGLHLVFLPDPLHLLQLLLPHPKEMQIFL